MKKEKDRMYKRLSKEKLNDSIYGYSSEWGRDYEKKVLSEASVINL